MDDVSPVMRLLRAHVPLTLLLDLARPPSSADLLRTERPAALRPCPAPAPERAPAAV